MREIIKSIIKEYTQEKRVDWIKEHCNSAFDEDYNRNFCYAATKVIKDDYRLQEKFSNLINRFVDKYKDEINTIKWETLTSEHEIAKIGLKELEWVMKNGKQLCPEIGQNIRKILTDLNNGVYVFYVDKNTGEYHLLNRLDTNYSALAVMITEYFRTYDAIYAMNLRIKSPKGWEEPVKHLINHIINPTMSKMSPFNDDIFKDINFDEKPLKYIFNNLIENLESKISEKTYRVLKNVREVGFETERKFIKELEKHGIEYENFGRDYGLVDRKLGIDLFVKLNDGWYPVQVKSSEREQTLITKLGCEGALVVYPDKGRFWVGNISFEQFFCKMLKICKDVEVNSDETNQ
jgi:hypothetical protein